MIVLEVAAFMLLILLALAVLIVVAGTITNIALRIVFWIDDRLDDVFDRRKKTASRIAIVAHAWMRRRRNCDG